MPGSSSCSFLAVFERPTPICNRSGGAFASRTAPRTLPGHHARCGERSPFVERCGRCGCRWSPLSRPVAVASPPSAVAAVIARTRRKLRARISRRISATAWSGVVRGWAPWCHVGLGTSATTRRQSSTRCWPLTSGYGVSTCSSSPRRPTAARSSSSATRPSAEAVASPSFLWSRRGLVSSSTRWRASIELRRRSPSTTTSMRRMSLRPCSRCSWTSGSAGSWTRWT
mmetsp:Transcript_65488/g.188751  ORF Transcript_65488/g.188751 Transcript_65488/m.188751 type:complete len:227 (+) Transcript_65488:1168-1848(+)